MTDRVHAIAGTGVPDQEGEDSSTAVDRLYAQMQLAVTNAAAAVEIAKASFPAAGDMPRIAPLPFVHAGHSVLLDYDLLARTLWNAALRLKEIQTKWSTRKKLRGWAGVGAAGIAFLVGIVIFGWTAPAFMLAATFGVFAAILTPSPEEVLFEAVEERLKTLETLRRNEEPKLHPSLANWTLTPRIAVGSGRTDGDAVPVIIADKGRRFRGYGREQVDQLFVCPPKEHRDGRSLDEPELQRLTYDAVVRAASTAGFRDVLVGSAIVLDGASLHRDSEWLDDERRPFLWYPASRLEQVRELDPRASVRCYRTVQILFPDHSTIATLFVRVFAAGSAAGVEITLATLGPVASEGSLASRVHQLRLQLDSKKRKARAVWPSTTEQSFYARALRAVRVIRTPSGPDALPDSWPEARELRPFDTTEQEALRKDAREVLAASSYWPGNWAGLSNWREQHSLTFTPDYFGGSESRASIRAIYERISAALLDCLEEQEFDIRTYRDRDGKMNIQADKIDKLVIGERIVLEREGSARDVAEGGKPKESPVKGD